MKILLLNGSTREKGSTRAALDHMASLLNREGLETEIIWVGNKPVRDCTGCRKCRETRDNTCVFKDDAVNALIAKADEADGFVFGTPVYFSHPSGALLSVLDRMFYAGAAVMRGKPGCSVAIARRGGCSLTLQTLNQYFLFNEMPLAAGSYWAMAHGTGPDQVPQDTEGMQTLANLARNLAYLVKSLDAAGRAGLAKPANEYGARTNFIR